MIKYSLEHFGRHKEICLRRLVDIVWSTLGDIKEYLRRHEEKKAYLKRGLQVTISKWVLMKIGQYGYGHPGVVNLLIGFCDMPT